MQAKDKVQNNFRLVVQYKAHSGFQSYSVICASVSVNQQAFEVTRVSVVSTLWSTCALTPL